MTAGRWGRASLHGSDRSSSGSAKSATCWGSGRSAPSRSWPAALRERGFRATQATISRDVAELGLIKSSHDGVQSYVVPARVTEAESTGEERLRALLHDLPVEVREAGLMLVLQDAAGFRARHRGRAGPNALAGGGRQHRRRRHCLRRLCRPHVDAAHPRPAAPARAADRSPTRLRAAPCRSHASRRRAQTRTGPGARGGGGRIREAGPVLLLVYGRRMVSFASGRQSS